MTDGGTGLGTLLRISMMHHYSSFQAYVVVGYSLKEGLFTTNVQWSVHEHARMKQVVEGITSRDYRMYLTDDETVDWHSAYYDDDDEQDDDEAIDSTIMQADDGGR